MLRASLGTEQFPIIYDRIFFPLGGNFECTMDGKIIRIVNTLRKEDSFFFRGTIQFT